MSNCRLDSLRMNKMISQKTLGLNVFLLLYSQDDVMDEHRIEMQYAAAVDRQNAVSDVGQVLFAILFFFFFFFFLFCFFLFYFFVSGHV